MGVMVLHLNQRKPLPHAPRQGVGVEKIVWGRSQTRRSTWTPKSRWKWAICPS